MTASDHKLLYKAATDGNVSAIEALLDNGVLVNQDYSGWTALGTAAYHGYADVVKLLLDRGADIDFSIPQKDGTTALSYAALGGHIEIAKNLIAKGADIRRAVDSLNRMFAGSETQMGIELLERLQGKSESTEPAASSVHPGPIALTSLSPNYSNAAALDDYAVIVGIEKYPDLPAATYAEARRGRGQESSAPWVPEEHHVPDRKPRD